MRSSKSGKIPTSVKFDPIYFPIFIDGVKLKVAPFFEEFFIWNPFFVKFCNETYKSIARDSVCFGDRKWLVQRIVSSRHLHVNNVALRVLI